MEYVTGAFMAVLIWWVDHGAKLPPQQVDSIFRRLVMQGLAVELGLGQRNEEKAPPRKSR